MSEEFAIIGTNWRRFWSLVRVERVTDKRIYYRGEGTGRTTYCEIGHLRVRNATPELFQKLKSMEGDHEQRMRQAASQMKDQFEERCRKVIAEAAAIPASAEPST